MSSSIIQLTPPTCSRENCVKNVSRPIQDNHSTSVKTVDDGDIQSERPKSAIFFKLLSFRKSAINWALVKTLAM